MAPISAADWQHALIEHVDADELLYWHADQRILSVFDDSRFDRSDIDILSPAMRQHVIASLKTLDCQLVRGNQLIAPHGISLWMPKPSVLASSPFDATRYQRRASDDIYILTPTQAAAYQLEHCQLDIAVKAIADMMPEQPCNLRKLEDFITQDSARQRYLAAMPYLRNCLREAQEQPHMRFKRHQRRLL